MAKEYAIDDVYGMELNLEVLLNNKASKVKFIEVSKYPSVSRDLALVVKEDVKVADILNSIRKNGKLGKENIIQNVEVFDVYTLSLIHIFAISYFYQVQYTNIGGV